MNGRALLLVAGLGTAAMLIGWLSVGSRDDGLAWRPLAATVAPPDRENVAGSYHVREMQLRSRLEREPGDSAGLLELARLLQDAHRPAEAARLYERYLEAAPSDRQAWLDRAASHGDAGDWAAAESAMRSMLERFPGDPAGMHNLGATLANQNRALEARPWFERAAAQTVDAATARAARLALNRLREP